MIQPTLSDVLRDAQEESSSSRTLAGLHRLSG